MASWLLRVFTSHWPRSLSLQEEPRCSQQRCYLAGGSNPAPSLCCGQCLKLWALASKSRRRSHVWAKKGQAIWKKSEGTPSFSQLYLFCFACWNQWHYKIGKPKSSCMDADCLEALQMFAGLTQEECRYFIDQSPFCFVLIWKVSAALHSICLFFFFSHMIMYTYNRWIIPLKSHKEKNSSYVCLSGQWIIDDRYNGNNYILLRNFTQSPAQKASFKTCELCSCIQGCECQVRKQPGGFQISVIARKYPLQVSAMCWQIVYT